MSLSLKMELQSFLSLLKTPMLSLSVSNRLLMDHRILRTRPSLGSMLSSNRFCNKSLTYKVSRPWSKIQCNKVTSSSQIRSTRRNPASSSSFKSCATRSRPSSNSNNRQWRRPCKALLMVVVLPTWTKYWAACRIWCRHWPSKLQKCSSNRHSSWLLKLRLTKRSSK